MKYIISLIIGDIASIIVGYLSLLVGVISLIISLITMKTAKNIEQEVNKSKKEFGQKNDFKDNYKRIIKKLEEFNKLVCDEGKVTRSIINESISLVSRIRNYDELFDDDTIEKLSTIVNELRKIDKEKANNLDNVVYNYTECIGKAVSIINVEEKIL